MLVSVGIHSLAAVVSAGSAGRWLLARAARASLIMSDVVSSPAIASRNHCGAVERLTRGGFSRYVWVASKAPIAGSSGCVGYTPSDTCKISSPRGRASRVERWFSITSAACDIPGCGERKVRSERFERLGCTIPVWSKSVIRSRWSARPASVSSRMTMPGVRTPGCSTTRLACLFSQNRIGRSASSIRSSARWAMAAIVRVEVSEDLVAMAAASTAQAIMIGGRTSIMTNARAWGDRDGQSKLGIMAPGFPVEE